jgi:tetratricopeptide (TPR) repeat protein
MNLRTGKDAVGHHHAIPRVFWSVQLVALALSSVFAADHGHTEIGSLVQQNKLQEAQQQLQKVLTQNPRDASALSRLGEVKNRQRQYKQAEQLFKQAIQIDPALVGAQQQLAGLYADEERIDESIAVYEKIRKLQPQNGKARQQLSILFEQKGKHERSLELAKSIPVAARPDRLLPVMVSDYLGLNQSERRKS